jgi:hypothetical protein
VVEHGIAFRLVTEQGDERNGIAWRLGERADDKGKIVGGELSAAIRLNHVRVYSMPNAKRSTSSSLAVEENIPNSFLDLIPVPQANTRVM